MHPLACRDEQVPATIFLTTGFLDGTDLWFDYARRGLEAAVEAGDRLSHVARRTLADCLGHWPSAGSINGLVDRLKYLQPEARARVLDSLHDAKLPLAPAAKPLTWDQVREMHAEGIEMGGVSVEDLFEPAVNIRLGASLLEDLLDRFDGRASAAVASYNAGHVSVARWLARNDLADDEWVEEIPYDQTRGYVKRVLRSMHAYRVLY